jgi:ribosomal protein S18 acetylase RimI-like enzyme
LPLLDAHAITIRAATRADAPAIGRLHVESWRETYSEVLPDRLLQSLSALVRAAMGQGAFEPEPPILLFVAERPGGELVGFAGGGRCRAASLPYDAEVYAIYVLRAVQQRGCGRRLMAALAAALQARGFDSICLWVLRENATARAFYERLGGGAVGERTEIDGEETFDEVAYGWASLDSLRSAAADLRDDH